MPEYHPSDVATVCIHPTFELKSSFVHIFLHIHIHTSSHGNHNREISIDLLVRPLPLVIQSIIFEAFFLGFTPFSIIAFIISAPAAGLSIVSPA